MTTPSILLIFRALFGDLVVDIENRGVAGPAVRRVCYTAGMGERSRSAADFLPVRRNLTELKKAAAKCKGCELYRYATQTVFGEGSAEAAVVLVGEVPGDQEDKEGRPFVGPAGTTLDRALGDAGIPKDKAYITNAVKHFKWEPRGKRRLHKRPRDTEVEACKPWLVAELEAVHPQVVVCMGVTAARSVFGKTVRLKDLQGRFWPTPLSTATYVTIHPSAILRLPESEQRHNEYARFVADLQQVRARLHS